MPFRVKLYCRSFDSHSGCGEIFFFILVEEKQINRFVCLFVCFCQRAIMALLVALLCVFFKGAEFTTLTAEKKM